MALVWLGCMILTLHGNIKLVYEQSHLMAADIYTKAFSDPARWEHALLLANVLNPKQIDNVKNYQQVLDESALRFKKKENKRMSKVRSLLRLQLGPHFRS